MLEMGSVALFGEAQKGDLETIYYCRSVGELYEHFGEPPSETEGLFFAIKTILSGFPIIYFRVREEGMNSRDYLFGLKLLNDCYSTIPKVGAIYLPKVGIQEVINESLHFCQKHQGLLIMCERDFYDYITNPYEISSHFKEERT